MKIIHLKTIVLLIISTVSNTLLYAADYPGNENATAYPGENNEVAKSNIQNSEENKQGNLYSSNNQQKPPTDNLADLSAAQTRFTTMRAANNALRNAGKNAISPSQRRQRAPQQVQRTSAQPVRNQQLQPPHFSNRYATNRPTPINRPKLPAIPNFTLNTKSGSAQKCKTVCGQYSNYTYATLISSIVQSNITPSIEMLRKVKNFTNGAIQTSTQCSAEALTPYLSGKNKLYSLERFYPGMPKPQLFYRVCKRQCLQGRDGVIFQSSDPVIAQLIKQFEFTHGERKDKTLAMIAKGGNGGFENQVIPNSSARKPLKRPQKRGMKFAG